MLSALQAIRKNRTFIITLAILLLLFYMAIQGLETKDWVITFLRGLSVGSVTFLVAAGFSLIFGLLDVLNLAHGTLFMIGAYIGWTVFVRPDTFIDLLTPAALIVAGFALMPLWERILARVKAGSWTRLWPWLGLLVAAGVLFFSLSRYPITKWNPEQYENSPVTNAFLSDTGQFVLPEPEKFTGIPPWLGLSGILLGGVLIAFSLQGIMRRGEVHTPGTVTTPNTKAVRSAILLSTGITLLGLVIYFVNTPLTNWLFNFNSNGRFFIAVLMAALSGVALGGLMETSLIRPLYERPIYQLMLTLGLSAVGIEIVRQIWGRPEFVMPKPALFTGSGEGCPAKSLSALLTHHCSTISILGGRVRTYNEIFIPLVGLVVLITVWLLLQRTRIGMVIRAGVQDREMVEALGINVRRIFTLVFALGVGLAALGGVLAAPSMGLSTVMGDNLLLNALIALAIGGLTSYPGAAAGSLLVGMIQQFIIKYGQVGIHLPFLTEPFKPSPPLVPASTVLLMVVILLALPHGLFGRKE